MEFYEKLRKSLETSQTWPGTYLFKFIIPADQKTELLTLLPLGRIDLKESGSGKYVVVSLTSMMDGPSAVVEIYQRVSTVSGIVSL